MDLKDNKRICKENVNARCLCKKKSTGTEKGREDIFENIPIIKEATIHLRAWSDNEPSEWDMV